MMRAITKRDQTILWMGRHRYNVGIFRDNLENACCSLAIVDWFTEEFWTGRVGPR
jgi:hypothetical protein